MESGSSPKIFVNLATGPKTLRPLLLRETLISSSPRLRIMQAWTASIAR